jgi:hypothetical protein
MSTGTQVVLMFRFLLIFSFRDVSTVKRFTSNNQDIGARPFVLIIVVLTKV